MNERPWFLGVESVGLGYRVQKGLEKMRLIAVLLMFVCCSGCYGQLADLRANKYDPDSLSNPFGAGSIYRSDGLMNPYSQFGNRYSADSWRNPYATTPPRLSNGGQFSSNRYLSDSVSNPYGRFGSRFSSESIQNPFGEGSSFLTKPLYVFPQSRR